MNLVCRFDAIDEFLPTAGDAHFGVDVPHVSLGGAFGDEQLVAYIGDAAAAQQQLDDFRFARRQVVEDCGLGDAVGRGVAVVFGDLFFALSLWRRRCYPAKSSTKPTR